MTLKISRSVFLAGFVLYAACGRVAHAAPTAHFAIEVVDADTGRGVPLVELKTTNDVRYYTDSNGIVAYHEPGLMGQKVFFSVSSPGYDYPADGFGSRGKALDVVAGGSAKITIKRINIAERLYRVTGQGIYGDSVLVGRVVPTKNPVLNGGVMGQDSVYALPYRDKLYWFWGDTNRASYPLGNYGMSGAVSDLPSEGGTDPSRGIDLTYFTNAEGFSRPMSKVPGKGVTWVDGIAVVRDGDRQRLFGGYERLEKLGVLLERGLVAYDDETETFLPLATLPMTGHAYPRGHSMHATVDGVDYIYFAYPYPLLRVRNDWKDVTNLASYEAFTPLKPGSRYDANDPPLDRDAAGKLVYGWKKDTDPVGVAHQDALLKSGKITPEDVWLRMRDVETKDPIAGHNGTVAWNAFRKKYVMIFTQHLGKASLVGEIWYSEADAPEGPWQFARKVATHPNYSFYNPCHHPFFDGEGGKIIYFEGTYTAEFSGAKFPTPRYNYNQIMYRLDLSDPRLALP